jgi:hypothetical protein
MPPPGLPKHPLARAPIPEGGIAFGTPYPKPTSGSEESERTRLALQKYQKRKESANLYYEATMKRSAALIRKRRVIETAKQRKKAGRRKTLKKRRM